MLDINRLRYLVHYNPNTGVFINLHKRGLLKPGDRCGSERDDGQGVEIRINYRKYKAHQLAIFYMTGIWPKYVTHVNGDNNDNIYNNLKITTKSEIVSKGNYTRHSICKNNNFPSAPTS